MSVIVYPAVATSPETGGLEGRFVDFPALVVVAPTPAELIRLAREALSAELQRLERAGDTWPDPTPVGQVDVPAGASALLIDVSVDDTPVRLTISLGERLLKRIDQDAEARSMTRSGYLALGARRLLDEGRGFAGEGGEGADAGRRLQEEIAALGRRVNETLGPQSPIGRTLAELDAMALEGLRRLGGEVRSAMASSRSGRTARPVSDPPAAEATDLRPPESEPGR